MDEKMETEETLDNTNHDPLVEKVRDRLELLYRIGSLDKSEVDRSIIETIKCYPPDEALSVLPKLVEIGRISSRPTDEKTFDMYTFLLEDKRRRLKDLMRESRRITALHLAEIARTMAKYKALELSLDLTKTTRRMNRCMFELRSHLVDLRSKFESAVQQHNQLGKETMVWVMESRNEKIASLEARVQKYYEQKQKYQREEQIENIECPACRRRVGNNYSFRRHTVRCYNLNSYVPKNPCNVCFKQFNVVAELHVHQREDHKNFLVKCQTCDYIFHGITELREHLLSEHYL